MSLANTARVMFAKTRVATNSVFHDSDRPSHITLDVVPE